MKYLLAVVMLLVCATCTFADGSCVYLGQYTINEYVNIPIVHVDSALAGRARFPDTVVVQCWKAGASRVRTFTAFGLLSNLYSGLGTIDTGKYVFSGALVDTSFSWRVQVTTLGNANAAPYCLTCDMMTSPLGTLHRNDQIFVIQVVPDTVGQKQSMMYKASGSGTAYLKVDSIISAGRVSLTRFVMDSIEYKKQKGDSIVLAGKFARGTDSASRVKWYSTTDTTWSVATSASGKPAVAWMQTAAAGAGGSNGFYVSSAAREGVHFTALHATNSGAFGMKLSSASSGAGGVLFSDLSSSYCIMSEDITVGTTYPYIPTNFTQNSINAIALSSSAVMEIRDTLMGGVRGIVTSAQTDSGLYSATLGAVTNFYVGCPISFYYGTGKNQSAVITRSVLNTGDTLRFYPKLTTAPAQLDSFVIYTALRGLYGQTAKLFVDSSLASKTNITGGTITTTTNVTNGVTVTALGTGSIPNAAFQSQPNVNVYAIDGTVVATHVAGYFPSDVRKYVGETVPATNVTGVPIVDLKYVLGTQTDTTGASGRLAVNARYVANQLCAASAGVTFPSSIASPTNITSASGVALAADQAVNVTKIDGSAWSTHATGMAPSDIRDIAGAAVSTTTAQLGVNTVSYSAGQDPGSRVWGDNDSTWGAGTMGNMAKNDSTVLGAVKAALLDMQVWTGGRANAGAKYYRHATLDSLVLDTAGVRIGKRVYHHLSGTPGSVPDSSRTQ